MLRTQLWWPSGVTPVQTAQESRSAVWCPSPLPHRQPGGLSWAKAGLCQEEKDQDRPAWNLLGADNVHPALGKECPLVSALAEQGKNPGDPPKRGTPPEDRQKAQSSSYLHLLCSCWLRGRGPERSCQPVPSPDSRPGWHLRSGGPSVPCY